MTMETAIAFIAGFAAYWAVLRATRNAAEDSAAGKLFQIMNGGPGPFRPK